MKANGTGAASMLKGLDKHNARTRMTDSEWRPFATFSTLRHFNAAARPNTQSPKTGRPPARLSSGKPSCNTNHMVRPPTFHASNIHNH